MMLAIHSKSGSFSDRWIAYCERMGVPFKVVNCYETNIIEQLAGCDALMWHHHHADYKDVLFAKQLLISLQQAGIKVFPNLATNWHFDDKVGQKYLFESIGVPFVQSFVFYEKKTAVKWAKGTNYPKVFKLRGGAGSANVSLVRNQREAIKKIKKSFGRGYSAFNRIGNLKDRYNKYKSGHDTLFGLLKGIGRLFMTTEYGKMHGTEKGYAYFQSFIPNNEFDTRIVVVGNRAFALIRGVREGDFRASGSGKISYDPSRVNLEMVKMAFKVNEILKTQSIAFDFVLDNGKPLIVEISYCYAIEAYDNCRGFWDQNMNWHEGRFNPQEWMVENLIKEMKDQAK